MSSEGDACCVPTFILARCSAGAAGGSWAVATAPELNARAPSPAVLKKSRRFMRVVLRPRLNAGPRLRACGILRHEMGDGAAPAGAGGHRRRRARCQTLSVDDGRVRRFRLILRLY